MARTISSFKLAGYTNLPMQRTDEYVSSYLYYRKSHFNVLSTQFANIIGFKTLITGGLLVLGALLVVDRQITLGQFVASEIVIITIVNAVEKIIVSMDTVYDLLTAVEKIGQVTDIPLERENGLQFMQTQQAGASVVVKNLKYKYSDSKDYSIKDLNFNITPGQTVCLAGENGSGKTSLFNVLTGTLHDYEGIVTLNGLSVKDIKLPSLRHYVAKHVSRDEIFDGTILDNITLGRLDISLVNVLEAIENVGLSDFINSQPEGLNTPLLAEGRRISGSVLHKILLARCIASRPKLLLMEDFLPLIAKEERLRILSYLQDPKNGWTLICITNNPLWLASADQIMVMKSGECKAQGTYDEVKHLLE
jgi:ABC-type bacteriocin/lantibiotic exporter with double-glycine peptidase domain